MTGETPSGAEDLLGLRSGRGRLVALGVAGLLVLVTVALALVASVGHGLLGVVAALILGGTAATASLVLVSLRLQARRHHDLMARLDRVERIGRRAAARAETAAAEASASAGAVRKVSQQVRGVTRRQQRAKERALTRRDLILSTREASAHTQGLQLLGKHLDLPLTMPPMSGFAAAPDLLAVLVDTLVRERPRTVVESGSGVSTLVMALTVRQYDLACRVVALEHLAEYAEATRALLEHHGVADLAEVRHATLAPTGLPGHDSPWYDRDALEGLTDVGVLLVDGPPASTGEAPRYPMVPLLLPTLAADCTIIVDDTVRASDHDVVMRWHAEMPDFELIDLGLQKGAHLLRRRAGRD